LHSRICQIGYATIHLLNGVRSNRTRHLDRRLIPAA